MKEILFFITCIFIISVAHGSSMLDGNVLAPCFQPDKENLECIIAVTERSDGAVNLAYHKKLQEIKAKDEMGWWMGSKAQKTSMIDNFVNNQRLWLDYRNSYCVTIATPEENTHAYGEVQARCRINMNQRRIDEINMLYHPELDD